MNSAQQELVQTAVERIFTDGRIPSETLNISAGHGIYARDSAQNYVYFLHSGQVRIFHVRDDGHDRLASILGPSSFFGYGALSGVTNFNFRAVAAEDSILSRMNVDCFYEQLAENTSAVREVASAMAAHLISVHEDLQQLANEDCNHRLLQKLVGLSHSPAAERCEEGVILRLTHEELARHIGMARETVSLALTQLRNRNLLRTGRNRLIYNPDAIEAFGRASMQRVAAESMQ